MRLLVPSLAQALPSYHWLRGHNCRGQSTDGEGKLNLVESLAQHVELTRWRDTRPEKVEPIRKDERGRFQQGWCSQYVSYVRNLPNEKGKVSQSSKLENGQINARDSCVIARGAYRLGAMDHIGRAILPVLLQLVWPSSGVDLKAGGGTTGSDHFQSPLKRVNFSYVWPQQAAE